MVLLYYPVILFRGYGVGNNERRDNYRANNFPCHGGLQKDKQTQADKTQ